MITKQNDFIRKLTRESLNEAYLNKDVYDRKQEYAATRMIKNKENTSLTDEQHDALSNLCTVRHRLHTNIDGVVKSDNEDIKNKLILANIQLNESKITPMKFIPLDISDYIDIDTINELYEIEQIPENEEEKQEWYDDNYYRIYDEISNLNDKIEEYLKKIDEKYGTNYCPTGLSRKF